jgi:hypothetical protein
MMHEVAKLISWGSGTTRGIGHIDARAPEFARRFLVTNKQIGDVRALDNAYTMRFWEAVPPADRQMA